MDAMLTREVEKLVCSLKAFTSTPPKIQQDTVDTSDSDINQKFVTVCTKVLEKYPYIEQMCSSVGEQTTNDGELVDILINFWKSYADTDEKIFDVFEGIMYIVSLLDDKGEEFEQIIIQMKEEFQPYIGQYSTAISLLRQNATPCGSYTRPDDHDNMIASVCTNCNQFEHFHTVCSTYAKSSSSITSRCNSCGMDKYKHKMCTNFQFVSCYDCSDNPSIFSRGDDACGTCGFARYSHTTEMKDKSIFACDDFASDGKGCCNNCVFTITDHMNENRKKRSSMEIDNNLYETVEQSVQISKDRKECTDLTEKLKQFGKSLAHKDQTEFAIMDVIAIMKKLQLAQEKLEASYEQHISKYTPYDLRIMKEYTRLSQIN